MSGIQIPSTRFESGRNAPGVGASMSSVLKHGKSRNLMSSSAISPW